jgi:hypothetical protein
MATTDANRSSSDAYVTPQGKPQSTKSLGYRNQTPLAVGIIARQVLSIFWTAKWVLSDVSAWIGEGHWTYRQTHNAGPDGMESIGKALKYLEQSVAPRSNYASYGGALAEVDLNCSDVVGMEQQIRNKFVALALSEKISCGLSL